jgi:hypothetical protein
MKRAKMTTAKAIVIHPKVAPGDCDPDDARKASVGFYVMPPPRISGLDELWRVAAAAREWTRIALVVACVPKARELNGVWTMLSCDLGECFSLLEQALRTGTIPELNDCRAGQAAEVLIIAQQIMEMDLRGELSDIDDEFSDVVLALLSSGREALAAAPHAQVIAS